jgi:hypothetical protein
MIERLSERQPPARISLLLLQRLLSIRVDFQEILQSFPDSPAMNPSTDSSVSLVSRRFLRESMVVDP